MNTQELFKKQLADGATDVFFYAIETPADQVENIRIDMKSHKGTLATFPALTYVRQLNEAIPLFRE